MVICYRQISALAAMAGQPEPLSSAEQKAGARAELARPFLNSMRFINDASISRRYSLAMTSTAMRERSLHPSCGCLALGPFHHAVPGRAFMGGRDKGSFSQ